MGHRQPALLESCLQVNLHHAHDTIRHAIRLPGPGKLDQWQRTFKSPSLTIS
jgi:hypothetical protein